MATRRAEIAFKILEHIGDRIVNLYDFMESFLAAGYGASLGRMEYEA